MYISRFGLSYSIGRHRKGRWCVLRFVHPPGRTRRKGAGGEGRDNNGGTQVQGPGGPGRDQHLVGQESTLPPVLLFAVPTVMGEREWEWNTGRGRVGGEWNGPGVSGVILFVQAAGVVDRQALKGQEGSRQ